MFEKTYNKVFLIFSKNNLMFIVNSVSYENKIHKQSTQTITFKEKIIMFKNTHTLAFNTYFCTNKNY